MLTLFIDNLWLILNIHLNRLIAFVLYAEIFYRLLCFVPKEQHTLQVISWSVEVIDKAAFHPNLDDLILEEDAFCFQAVCFEALFLLFWVEKKSEFLTVHDVL